MAEPGFNIQTFNAYLNDTGVLKSSKFLVRFTLPPGLFGLSETYSTLQRLEFYCSDAKLPGIQLQTHEVSRFGYGVRERKPGNPTFQEIPFAFIGDGNGAIWNFFYKWHSLIYNFDMREGIVRNGVTGSQHEPYEISYKYEYAVDMDVIAYDETGQEKIHIKLREAFPFALGSIDLSWSAHNQIMVIPVAFAFTDWHNALEPPNNFNTVSVFN